MRQRRLLTTMLAVTALSISALMGAAPAMADDPPPPWGAPYVAIGDSVASGNGLMPYYDPACLRSKKAYPTVLAGMLGGSVVSAACSGATIQAVIDQALDLADQQKLGPATRLVTITVGVNDLSWIQVVGACSNLGSLGLCRTVLGGISNPAVGHALASGIAGAIYTVRANAPLAQIRVTGYPELFGQFTGTCSVGAAMPGTPMKFAQPQGLMLNTAVAVLTQAISTSPDVYEGMIGQEDPGVEFVDVTDAFAGHGLCDTGERWVSGLVSGQPKDRGFHPNAAGQQAYARTIAATLLPG